jgi:hypothetical protein
LSLIDFRTSLAVFMNTPYGLQVVVIWPQAATVGDAQYLWGLFNTISECPQARFR